MDLGIQYRRVVPFILAIYILAVAITFLYFNVRLTIEWVAIILFVAALMSGKALLFVRDWGVFLLVLIAWQLTSPLAVRFPFPWHLQELIAADKFLFAGTVPTVWLQVHLHRAGVLEPWDVLATVMYMLHFLTPLLAGFALWATDREMFRKFAMAFVLVAVAGFATYILYPAVPPWMAGKPLVLVNGQYLPSSQFPGMVSHVYLPGVQNLFQSVMGHWYNPNHGTIVFGSLHQMRYDAVAAMPSEHAAYPFLFFLVLRRQFGRPAYFALIYIGLVIFSITYLGQHYIIDALVGFAYAGAGYATIMHVVPRFRGVWPTLAKPRLDRSVGKANFEEV